MKICVTGGFHPGHFTKCDNCGFTFEKTGQNNSYCSVECRTKASWKKYSIKYRLKDPLGCLLRSARHRAKKNGIEFSITKKDIELPTHCPVFGFKLESNVDTGQGGKDNSYSLDRIDNTKGYIPGNVQVISHKANSMKHSANKEELAAFAKWILKDDKDSSNS